ncbi:MAG: hypothetical protein CBC55_00755 [Gammaproteobacteria bacterium TMED95]|nr:MAG: hypothetical protein CBC55_00755 [Gammaproteobacteria bacterium TMED95]|tara:strand:- start:3264 stop:3719 length:456 start_codon:yes stop_codon:yes gene_type:complete
MHFGIDFDETINRDISLWQDIISTIISADHQVSIITIRSNKYGNDDIECFANFANVPVIYTHGCQKETFTDAIGLKIDIWIDDSPLFIPKCDAMPNVVLSEYRSKQRNLNGIRDIENYKAGKHQPPGFHVIKVWVLNTLATLMRIVAGHKI